jgi:hypothetical protein
MNSINLFHYLSNDIKLSDATRARLMKNVETKLRYEKEYIPSSKSSMYVKPNIPSTHTIQPYPELFARSVAFEKPSNFKDKNLFYNSTSQKINY